jgi:hypothetical protein
MAIAARVALKINNLSGAEEGTRLSSHLFFQ